MTTIEYASALDPLLDTSTPPDWLVAVVPEPGQLLADSDQQEEQLLGELLSGEQPVATRLGFVYYRGLAADQEKSIPSNQISVRYDLETDHYELTSAGGETTVESVDAAAEWIDEQFLAVETLVDTYLTVSEVAADIDGLGPTGIHGLVDTFETVDAIRDADTDLLSDVLYVSGEHAVALQTVLDDTEAIETGDPTSVERELRSVDGPLILDLQEGPIAGELVPSGASVPTYSTDGIEWISGDRR